MTRNVLLLKAINVGGKNILPMKDLHALLESFGAENVATYIQSGNVAFDGALTRDRIERGVERTFGFHSDCYLFNKARFAEIAKHCPYADEGKKVHIYYCLNESDFDNEKADGLKSPTEAYSFHKTHLYLHAPDGVGRSKLAAALPKLFSSSVTARNMNTVNKLLTI